ncbi:MAG: hypothetical protein JSU74_07565 [Candidatus Zixiibacteriota bacterium]|nr:MAG: hypothetical protein JSU74_07565 [candidate division Zixibacteria bacterium]
MLKRILVFVTLVSMLNLILHCTKSVKKPVTEITQKRGDIHGLVLMPSDTVYFDEYGGQYYPQTRRIEGVAREGFDISRKIEDVSYVIMEVPDDSGAIRTVFRSAEKFTKQDRSVRTTKVVRAILKDGSVVSFNDAGARYNPRDRSLNGFTRQGQGKQIPIDEVLYVVVKQSNPLLTALLICSAAAVMVAIAISLSNKEEPPPRVTPDYTDTESCPLVYSWDGERFVLEAEPLGGSITRALERTDYSMLEHAVPDDHRYHLMLTNEMHEVQYLNELSLLLVDHPERTSVAPDGTGELKLYSNPMAPLTAADETGRDIMNFVKGLDTACWQTDMSSAVASTDSRHHLTFQFERPAGTNTARLVYRSGTSQWASNMIRKMHQAGGDAVASWRTSMINGGLPLLQTFSFFDREELFWLKVSVDKGDQSIVRGLMLGGGPLVHETHVVDLDITDIPGDTLTVHINPPKGFWSIDYVAVDYGTYAEPDIVEIPLSEAADHEGVDVTGKLDARDFDYHIMPNTGDWIEARFDVPDEDWKQQRSVVLKTSGYYQLIFDDDRPQDKELIRRVLATPGAIVDYSLSEYAAWYDSVLAGIE